jgi:hypothetical protein
MREPAFRENRRDARGHSFGGGAGQARPRLHTAHGVCLLLRSQLRVGETRSRQLGESVVGEEGVDCGGGAGEGEAAGSGAAGGDRGEVVAAGLAIVGAVDFAAQRVGQEGAVDDQFFGLGCGELDAWREGDCVV